MLFQITASNMPEYGFSQIRAESSIFFLIQENTGQRKPAHRHILRRLNLKNFVLDTSSGDKSWRLFLRKIVNL